MDFLPCAQKRCQVLKQPALNGCQVAPGEAVIFAERHGTLRAIQFEDGFMPLPDGTQMRWAMCGGSGCSDSFRRFLSGSSVFRFRLPEVLADG
jgi:hypothetical protein